MKLQISEVECASLSQQTSNVIRYGKMYEESDQISCS